MHMKMLDLETLAKGSPRQRDAHRALKDLALFEKLKAYGPVLAGTVPLDVDIETSDLDIICGTDNLETFADEVKSAFGAQTGFRIEHKAVRGRPTVVIRFEAGGFPIEIFAQDASPLSQPAVIHMLIEARLLSFAPREARERVRTLKRAGLKTEPAFAEIFAIQGDPFEELLKIARLPDHEILHIAHRFLFAPH